MRYRVEIPYVCYVTLEVNADDEEDAIEVAVDESYIEGYCGNNASDRLIGVTTGSIEVVNMPLEHGEFQIMAELIA